MAHSTSSRNSTAGPPLPWEQARNQGLEIQRLIEEEVTEEALDQSSEFFESVAEGAAEVVETIERTRRVTPKQQRALDNWQRGVEGWLS